MNEFDLVILAGGDGRRLKPLTDGTPKALLPLANRPLLSYQLEFVNQVGFKKVIVVATHSNHEAVRLHIENSKQELEDLVIHLEVFDDFLGSAGCLLKLKDKIQNHVIVMSGDLIVEDQFLHHMADLHRARDAAVTLLTYQESLENDQDAKPSKENAITDFFGIDPTNDRLLLTESSNDLEASSAKLRVQKSLLKRFPNFTLHTNLRDAHFYMFSKWTLELLEQNKQMIQSIKTHFIPYLIKSQFRKKKTEEIKIPNYFSNRVYNMSSTYTDPDDRVKCFVWRLDPSAYCSRVSNFDSYMKINREIASGEKFYVPLEPQSEGKHKYFIAPSAQVSGNTQVTTGSVVGEGTTIADKVGVKKSIIGKHCIIGPYAKIANSVILDHVNIAEGAKIQNCIIGPNSYIDPHATLTDCYLGTASRVPPGSTWTGRKNAGNI
uniref:Translation initiation factor eIF2B subunit gamma n=1 Tax=Arcella intermedia TaxID=1963864 RepID=A0A6B2L4L6_9EUKA